MAAKGQKAKKTFVLDTSVLLADPGALYRFAEHEVIIPIAVIGELETKRDHPELGYFARAALRALDDLRVSHGRLDKALTITPEGGTLSLNGQSVLAGALINANDISAGRLVFSSSSTGDSTNLATLTFTVQDQSNDFSLTSNILSINRAPQVSNFTSSALREQTDNSTLTTTIPISFTDIDTADIGHTVTVSGVTTSGVVSGLSGFSNAQLISWLSPEAVTKLVNSNAGSANLSFNAPASALNYLGQDQSVTLNYQVAVNDGNGGITTNTAVITIAGSNDAPVIAPIDVVTISQNPVAAISFDFLRIDSWDGESFKVYLNNNQIFSKAFGWTTYGSAESGISSGITWSIAPSTPLGEYVQGWNYPGGWDQKFTVTWKSPTQSTRRTVTFRKQSDAEVFYKEKHYKNQSPALYITETITSTRLLQLNTTVAH